MVKLTIQSKFTDNNSLKIFHFINQAAGTAKGNSLTLEVESSTKDHILESVHTVN